MRRRVEFAEFARGQVVREAVVEARDHARDRRVRELARGHRAVVVARDPFDRFVDDARLVVGDERVAQEPGQMLRDGRPATARPRAARAAARREAGASGCRRERGMGLLRKRSRAARSRRPRRDLLGWGRGRASTISTVPSNGLPDPRDRAARHARADGARRVRRRRAQRAPGGERDGPLPRASRLQGRREVPDLQATSTRPPSGSAACSTPTPATTSSPSTSPFAPRARPRRSTCSRDFVGRPRLDAEELDRERGVVIQEINRAYDQPSMVAEYLIDRAAFGEHPLGRTVLGPEENLRSFTREGIVAFRERRWAGPRGGAFLVGNVEHLPAQEELHELFARFPALPEPEPYEPAPEFAPQTLVEERDTNQSHLRMIYRPDDRRRATCASAPRCRSTRRCSAARWARGCSTRSARSAACATRCTRSTTPSPTSRSCSSARASSRPSASRPTRACARSSTSCATTGPTEEEVAAGARLRRRAPGARLREHQRRRPLRGQPEDRVRRGHRPRRGDRGARRGHLRARSRRSRAGVADSLAVACVGPHTADEF